MGMISKASLELSEVNAFLWEDEETNELKVEVYTDPTSEMVTISQLRKLIQFLQRCEIRMVKGAR